MRETSVRETSVQNTRMPGSRARRLVQTGALLAALAAAATPPASALQLASSSITVTTPQGSITLVSSVDDNVGGDTSRWLFSYELGGTWNVPGGNGISSLQLFFGGLVDDVADRNAPAGWELDCCFALPPFGVGFDQQSSFGAGPNGSVVVSFSVPAGTGWTSESQASFAGSWVGGVPEGFVLLEDDVSGAGPIVPVPEPQALVLVALGIAALARRSRGAVD